MFLTSCKTFFLPLTFRAVGLVAAVCVGVGACATADEAGKPVTYSLTAKQNYEKGLVELKDENYLEANKFFSFVKQKFPFSKYAVLAELALADTQFQRGNHQEAIDAYRTFARLHPTHEKAEDGYVAFQVGTCYVREMPEDWFLIPPAYEKDQSSVHDALRELADFIDKYPDSQYLKQAQELRRQVVQRLIEHEVYVARFYLGRDKPKAAILRLEGAMRRYPDSGREAELLLALGQTQLHMGNVLSAKKTFQRVLDEHTSGQMVRRARLFLDFIAQHFGDSPIDAAAARG